MLSAQRAIKEYFSFKEGSDCGGVVKWRGERPGRSFDGGKAEESVRL